MIIDIHTHLFSPRVVENFQACLDDDNFSVLFSGGSAKIIDHVAMLKAMKESGIDHVAAMGFAWNKEEYCDEQNKYFAQVKNLSNGKIIPFGSVPLIDGSVISQHVKKIKEMGLAGIGEIAFYKEGLNNKNAVLLEKLLDSALIYDLPVCLHVNEPVGHDYPGKHNTDLGLLYHILKNYKNLKIILAHWGGGMFFYELMKEVNESLKNVFYDMAASPFLYSENIFEIALKIIGPDKILFGSDYPLIKFRRYIDILNKCIRSEENRAKILGLNAKYILKDHIFE